MRTTTALIITVFAFITILNNVVYSMTALETLLYHTTPNDESWGCINFTPYVHGYNPDWGPHPGSQVIDELLDILVTQTNYKCIQTYGVLNNLTYTFEAAQKRGLKVVAVIWLEPFTTNISQAINDESITLGIEMAKKYSDTIIAVSCGSEMRVRNTLEIANPPVLQCIQRVKAANIPQPVTSNDYYWFWCNAERPCKQWAAIADLVDYVAINTFSWWENQNSPTCVPAEDAPALHLKMYDEVVATYPNHPVIISEFGWPGGPDGAREINVFTNKPCTGIANEANQTFVVEQTIALLKERKAAGITFCAFRETWKTGSEGEIADYWGICDNKPPYKCKILNLQPPVQLPANTSVEISGLPRESTSDDVDDSNSAVTRVLSMTVVLILFALYTTLSMISVDKLESIQNLLL